MKKAIVIAVLVVVSSLWVYFSRIRPARSYDPTVRGSGTIEATEVVISAKVPARLLRVLVSEGDVVKAGQTLATLDCADLELRKKQALAQVTQARAALSQAEAALAQTRAGQGQAKSNISPLLERRDQARRDVERARALAASGSLAKSRLEQAETALTALEKQITAARAGVAVASQSTHVAAQSIEVMASRVQLAELGVQQADVALGECTLKAPLPAVVSARNFEPGELVLPGSALFRLARLDQVYTWIYVPNKEVGRVKLKQRAELLADTYPGRTFAGTVARINDRAEFTPKSIQTKEDRTRLVFGVKVELDNADHALLPGMPVEAVLTTGRL